MTKVRLGNLYLAAAVAGVILCAVLMRAFLYAVFRLFAHGAV